MTVTTEQARNWTAAAATDSAKRTHESVRDALTASRHLDRYEYDVFLQGSYANHTNLRGDSDVDIVVMLTSTWMPKTDRLTPAEVANWQARRFPGTATDTEFRNAVHQALADRYGTRVHPKNKCIRVDGAGGMIDADVVPVFQVRRYLSYPAHGQPTWIEGIQIWPLRGSSIVNYPKEHKKNGEIKNLVCDSLYKPTVRQVKRLAVRAADLGKFTSGLVPGYVLECMTYNVPSRHFEIADHRSRLLAVMQHLASRTAHTLRTSTRATAFTACS